MGSENIADLPDWEHDPVWGLPTNIITTVGNGYYCSEDNCNLLIR